MAIPNWIKVEQTTPDKPEVVQMAARLRIDQDAVVGKLFRLWIWSDQNAVADVAEVGIQVTSAFIDRLTNRKGFEAALIAVNWARRERDNLVLVNFTRHNGETAKERAQSNRRVAESRQRAAEEAKFETERKRNGNAGSVIDELPKPLPKPLPEEEEDQNTPHSPPQAGGAVASLPSVQGSKPAEKQKRFRRPMRLPDLKKLREELEVVERDIEDIRRPGGCPLPRRIDELSPEKSERLKKLQAEKTGLEELITKTRAAVAKNL